MLLMFVLVLILISSHLGESQETFKWATIFKQGQLNLSVGVLGPRNGSYIVARSTAQNGNIVYGFAQLDADGKAIGRFPRNPESESIPSSFQILLDDDESIYYTWIPVTAYLGNPGLETLGGSSLPFAKLMHDGDLPLGQWTPPDSGVLPFHGGTASFQGVECETGWVLIVRRLGAVQIDLLPLDASMAVQTQEDVEVISGDFYNQASNSQRWKWDVNYEAVSSNSFTMPEVAVAVPFTFNAKELRRAWAKVDKKNTAKSTPTPAPVNTSVLSTSAPEIITTANNLPSVPLTDTFRLPPSTVNNGAHETMTRVNKTFTATIDVDPYTLMTAEARVTRVRITIPYRAMQRCYDSNGILLKTTIIDGVYKSVSTVLSRVSLREPNRPCDRGFYGYDGTCTQCPPGSTSPPRSRTILSCRCDTQNGYAGTSTCTGCGADTYATATGCLPCPTGCNSAPFSSVCNCQAALNVQASNNMRASAATLSPAYPGFSAQEKKIVFAALLIIAFTLVLLGGIVIYLWKKQSYMITPKQTYRHVQLHTLSHHKQNNNNNDDYYPSSPPNTNSVTASTASISLSTNQLFGRRTPPLLSLNNNNNNGTNELGNNDPEMQPMHTRVRPAFQNTIQV